jgi:hypothetical protein
MSNYGQLVTFSTGSAPHLCSGVCLNFRTKDNLVRQIEDGEDGAILAGMQHSRTVDFSFDVKFTDASTDFPDLSSGAAITLAGLLTAAQEAGAASGGTALMSRAVETWRIGQAKTGSISGTYYPNTVQASPAAAGTLTAFTPAQSLGGLHPAGRIKWGTSGMTHGAGVLHGLTLTQELQLLPEEVSPAGTILSVFTANYMRSIQLEILALTSGTPPANGTILTVTGAPSHATGFRLENVEQSREIRGRKMWRCEAFWFNGID